MNSDMGLKDLEKRKCGKALEKMRKTYVKICKRYAKKRNTYEKIDNTMGKKTVFVMFETHRMCL